MVNNMSLKEQILKLIIENKRVWTILEISKRLKTDYKNTFQEINKLYPDLINKEKKGNLNLIELKISTNIKIIELERKRTAEFISTNHKIRLIHEDVERIDYPFFIVLIFGSNAKRKATEKSDIDLSIISDNKQKSKELVSLLHLLPQRIEIHQFTTEEFASMLKIKKNNIGKEIVKNNFILYGTENYYSLISKWMKKE